MAVQDELEAILARLQRMREQLRIDVCAIEVGEERERMACAAETVNTPPPAGRQSEV